MCTVLLVENEMFCNVLENRFAGVCKVRKAKNMEQLLCWLTEEGTDLLILDLDLPGSAAGDTVAAIQAAGKHSQMLFTAELENFDLSHPLTVVPAAEYILLPCSELELELTLGEAVHACAKQNLAEESARLGLVREKIESYIRTHYGEELSMQRVAHVMNYSETHFCRLFKQCFKVNFSAYLNEFRVEQAKRMLLTTNHSIKEIALNCGYQDTSYFIRVFKRSVNMTPLDYRISVQSMSRK